MATIERSFTTELDGSAMRKIFEEKALSRTDMKMFFGEQNWEGDTMNFKSMLAEGSIAFVDKEVKVNIELSMFGSGMKSQIEDSISQFPSLFQ
jgi:putative polyhydroxyalkanoate system protein